MISIITAVYNNQSGIESCINSVLAQADVDIEYIIIDGGSTDGTLQIIKQHEPELRRRLKSFILISEPDTGIYNALNKGLGKASGDIIGFLHSDDFFNNSSTLKTAQDCFNNNKTDIFYGDLVYIHSGSNGKILRYWKAGKFNSAQLNFGWMPPHPTMFCSSSLYKQIGLFDEQYSIASDYDMILRLLKSPSPNIWYQPEVIINMTAGGTSNKSVGNVLEKSRQDYRILKKHGFAFPLFTLACKNVRKITQFFIKHH